MQAHSRRAASVVVGLVAAGLVLAAGVAAGKRPAPAPALGPTSVAIVDVTKVMEGLTEFADRNKEFVTRGEIITRSLKELDDKIKQIDSELKNAIPPGDLKRRAEKFRELTENRALLQARTKGYEQLMEIEQGEVLHVLFTKLQAALATLARKEGIDIVLADDRGVQTSPSTSFGDNRNRIESRQVLFADDKLSLTDRLIAVMNNDYAAGAAPAATPTGTPAGTP